ncbi:hypothetical protein S40285_09966 [Stachybotrys chlorohalonatus IBT 40285]|uniref:Uncharacterized protein n=1 Tax=Stachybotrys chlorohalonatus (strain IBT 40285) TaxID=1283841 RepID=A0A084QB56_STAC4|nr:hypothetical protein S40285_09966 [Stachybotrys chlorohalonata IBT 40285]
MRPQPSGIGSTKPPGPDYLSNHEVPAGEGAGGLRRAGWLVYDAQGGAPEGLRADLGRSLGLYVDETIGMGYNTPEQISFGHEPVEKRSGEKGPLEQLPGDPSNRCKGNRLQKVSSPASAAASHFAAPLASKDCS